jgi:ribosomal protein S18 acetylase RimI-like enzyme
LCPFKKLKHQCEISLIVSEEYQRMGIGSHVLHHMIKYAQNQFRIKNLHLHVYKGNPSISLYKKFEFQTYGIQENWAWDGDDLKDRILMSKEL